MLYGKYIKERRKKAVKPIAAEGLSSDKTAFMLSLPESRLSNRVKVYRSGKLGEIGKNHKKKNETELETAGLKRELSEVKMK